MNNFFRTALLCLAIVTGLTGCGLRGDLYLPEEETGKQGQPASTEALDAPRGVEDAQGFSAAPADADEEPDEEEDEQPEVIYPDTGMPVTP